MKKKTKFDWKEFLKPNKKNLFLTLVIFMFLPVISIWVPGADVSYIDVSYIIQVTPIVALFYFTKVVFSFSLPILGIIIAYLLASLLLLVKGKLRNFIKLLFVPTKRKIIFATVIFIVLFFIGGTILAKLGTGPHDIFGAHRFNVVFDSLVFPFNLFAYNAVLWLTASASSEMLYIIPIATTHMTPSEAVLTTFINPIGSNIFGFIYDVFALIIESYIISCLIVFVHNKVKK